MYDTQTKKYVNHREILDIVKVEDIQILEVIKDDRNDVTAATLICALQEFHSQSSLEDIRMLVQKYHVIQENTDGSSNPV
jgi:hypothetical protein